ncbi:hypothetical protein B0H63DRAFT_534826, partial [Podospora didyma]
RVAGFSFGRGTLLLQISLLLQSFRRRRRCSNMRTILDIVVLGSCRTNAILILSDSESEGDLTMADLVQVCERLDTISNNNDVSEPPVNSGPGPDDEFADEQQQRGSRKPSPEPLSSSPKTLHARWTQPIPSNYYNTLRDTAVTDATSLVEHKATCHGHEMQHGPRPSENPCGKTSNHDGSICLDNEEWDMRFPFSSEALRRKNTAKSASQGPRLAASGLGFESQRQSDSHCLSQHYDREEQDGMCPAALPQVVESQGRTPTLPDVESTSELGPADAEPRLRPQSLCDAASGRGVNPQLRSGSCRLSQYRDHHDNSDMANDGEERHPLVPDGREQDKDETPAPQDRRAAYNSISEKTTQQQGNPALAAEASPVKPAGIPLTPGTGITLKLPDKEEVSLQQNIGHRNDDTAEKEGCLPIVGNDAKQGKDEDVVQPPQGKRRKTCEVKCSAAAFDTADRQNAHSMTLAVRGIVELFRAVKREDDVNGKILAFSVSHDHHRSVRIYGHYPVITRKDIKYYRHPIHTFDFTALDGKDKWTAYRFTNISPDSQLAATTAALAFSTWHVCENDVVAADGTGGVGVGIARGFVVRWAVIVPVMVEESFDSVGLDSEYTDDGNLEVAILRNGLGCYDDQVAAREVARSKWLDTTIAFKGHPYILIPPALCIDGFQNRGTVLVNGMLWIAKVLVYDTHSVPGAVRDADMENMPNIPALEEDDDIVRRPFGVIPVLLESIFNGVLDGLEEDVWVAVAEDLCSVLGMTVLEAACRCGDSKRLTIQPGDGDSANGKL